MIHEDMSSSPTGASRESISPVQLSDTRRHCKCGKKFRGPSYKKYCSSACRYRFRRRKLYDRRRAYVGHGQLSLSLFNGGTQ